MAGCIEVTIFAPVTNKERITTMKRIYTSAKMVLFAMMAILLLSSCNWSHDDDAYIAYDITGRWVGQLSEYYYDRFDWRVKGYTYSTMFEFYQGDRYGGRGREVDYDHYGNYRTYNFRWTVEYGNIYLNYSDGTELVIDGYFVRNNHLYGKTYNGSLEIDLIRYDYSYDPWVSSADYYYWSRQAKPDVEEADSVAG